MFVGGFFIYFFEELEGRLSWELRFGWEDCGLWGYDIWFC
jgi:hypothetical protein